MFKRENLPEKVRPKMTDSSNQNVIQAPTDFIDGLAGASTFGIYPDIYNQDNGPNHNNGDDH